MLSSAIDQCFSPHHIKEAFRKTGIFPFNPKVIDPNQLAPAEPNQHLLKEVTPLLISFLFKDNPPEKQDILCHACGHFIGQNPLVKQGLIPENLSEIFLPIFLPTSALERPKRRTIKPKVNTQSLSNIILPSFSKQLTCQLTPNFLEVR